MNEHIQKVIEEYDLEGEGGWYYWQKSRTSIGPPLSIPGTSDPTLSEYVRHAERYGLDGIVGLVSDTDYDLIKARVGGTEPKGRDKDILTLRGRGLSQQEIALRLGISQQTVSNRLKRL